MRVLRCPLPQAGEGAVIGAEFLCNPYSAQQTELRGIRRKYIHRVRYGLFYMLDEAADELIVMNIRHVARRWPWE